MREPELTIDLSDAAATESLGADLAESLPELGHGGLVVHLEGELGAGKTTCVRGFMRRLGVAGIVRSPTYTLVEPYVVGNLTCVHVDLYRLRHPSEVEELGLRDYLSPHCVLLIEWPDKGAGGVPPADLWIHIEYRAQARCAEMHARSTLGQTYLSRMQPLLGNN